MSWPSQPLRSKYLYSTLFLLLCWPHVYPKTHVSLRLKRWMGNEKNLLFFPFHFSIFLFLRLPVFLFLPTSNRRDRLSRQYYRPTGRIASQPSKHWHCTAPRVRRWHHAVTSVRRQQGRWIISRNVSWPEAEQVIAAEAVRGRFQSASLPPRFI